MTAYSIGWDIGGAHVKAALVNAQGDVCAVYQTPCPLWQGLKHLDTALHQILAHLTQPISRHAVTMTGELVDLFADRTDGVTQIVALMQTSLAQPIEVYAGRLGFIAGHHVKPEHSDAIASANWLASASYVAQKIPRGLFVDIGSTTTDIIVLQDHQVDAIGYSDYQRLVSGELVYTGIVRTALMAICASVYFNGAEVGLMSEYFATSADIYRLTGELNEVHDQSATADGQGKNSAASMRRLARMIGCDVQDFSREHWLQLAYALREQQLLRIQKACTRQLSRRPHHQANVLIGAGVGRFLAIDLAQRLGLQYCDFNSLLVTHTPEATAMQIADCAPAVAVALLALAT